MTRARDTANIDTILTTKGDIYAASAAYTPARQAVGSNNQVLMADSAQTTGLKFANEATATLTAKGDILTATAANTLARQAAGTNNHVLMADSAQTNGIKYAPEATATLTTTGDLLYASAANTLARRAIGSTGDVLTVSGGLPTWAAPVSGGMTSIASGSLSSTSVNISGIPGTYVDLVLYIRDMSWASGGSRFYIRVNSDSGATYYTHYTTNSAATTQLSASTAQWQFHNTDIDGANTFHAYAKFHDYAVTGNVKFMEGRVASASNTAATAYVFGNNPGLTGAITSIQIISGVSLNFDAGTYVLYGVK